MFDIIHKESLFLCKTLGALYYLPKYVKYYGIQTEWWMIYLLYSKSIKAATSSVPFVCTCANRFLHFPWYI